MSLELYRMVGLVPTRRAKYLATLFYVDLARNSIPYAFPASAHRRLLAGAPAMLTGMSIGASFHSWRRGDDLAHTPALILMFAAAVAARFHGAQFLPLMHRRLGGLFGGPTLARLPRELRPAASMLPAALGMAAIAVIAIVLSRMLSSVSQRSTASAQSPHY